MNWTNHRVLVTGGTRGIGRELVQGLIARGATVWATGRTPASTDRAAQQLPAAHWLACDIAALLSERDILTGETSSAHWCSAKPSPR